MNPFQITFGSEKNWRLELGKAAYFHKLWRLLQSSEILVQLFWGLSPVVCVRCPTVILLLNCTYIWCNYYHNKGFCCVCVKCSNISNIIDMNAQMTWERLWSSFEVVMPNLADVVAVSGLQKWYCVHVTYEAHLKLLNL